jgi:hypothetical protein
MSADIYQIHENGIIQVLEQGKGWIFGTIKI